MRRAPARADHSRGLESCRQAVLSGWGLQAPVERPRAWTMVDPKHAPPAQTPRERLRRIALLGVFLATTALTVAATAQIFLAVFRPQATVTSIKCRPGVRSLLASLSRARATAARSTTDERTALSAYRSALLPEWGAAEAIRQKCRDAADREALSAFRAVELLRYAEERAVRYDALDLSLLRQRAPALTRALFQSETQ